MTTAGLQPVVAACTGITTLSASATAIDSALLVDMALRLPSLRVVGLGGTDVDDAGVVRLAAACPRLEHISLDDCAHVTDVSIMALARACPRMRRISLPAQVSNEAATALLEGQHWRW